MGDGSGVLVAWGWRVVTRVKTMDGDVLEREEAGAMEPVKIPEDAQVGQVGVTAERKVNLGNYESAGISVYLCLPFDARDPGGAERTYLAAIDFCAGKVRETVGKLKEGKAKE